MEFKGTKGEWKVFEEFRNVKILNESNNAMFQSDIDCFDNEDNLHKYYSHNKILANAKLIASAPELLEALITLKKHYEELIDCGDCGNWNPREEDVVINSNKAINKALN